jgi:YidC/Oxa1 family membrane protein insertase
MDKRLMLVFALIFIVLLLLQPQLTKYFGGKNPPATSPQMQPPMPAAPPAVASNSRGRGAAAPVGTKEAAAEQDVVVENDVYRITFTNKGAQAKSWILKQYKDDKGRPLELVPSATMVDIQQEGQIVQQPAVVRYGYPMSYFAYDDGLRNRLNSALYVVSAQNSSDGKTRTVTFDYASQGISAHKSFTFDLHSVPGAPDPNLYVIKTQSQVMQNGQAAPAFLCWPAAGFGDQTVPASFAAERIDTQFGDKVTRLEPKKITSGATDPGPFNWAGTVDAYFGAVFLPDQPNDVHMVTLHNEVAVPKNFDHPDPREVNKVSVLGVAFGSQSGVTSGRWFVGPKAVNVIDNIKANPASGQASGPNLGGMVDFGFFGIIAKPLFIWLRWTHEHWTPNWGWSIIILTVVINLVLLPLRLTSMKSALKMQRVQPQITALKKKYEKYSMKDPRKQEMNREMSALFKEHGVNPAGGCLPLIVQLPFLWAFYTMLGAAIELRQAPWFWIRDLSSPDPYHILPVLIVVSTFAMQRMTPSPGMDPSQQKMMNLMMPVMLGVFSWAVAAGLGLYWMLGTVIAIIQQQVMNRTSLGQEIRSVAEKRARRKGQGDGKAAIR